MTYVLWIVQGLLALVFLFAGGTKLVLPLEELTAQMPVPGPLVRFIGLAEVLGALGLILPGLLRIRPGLTPLAAAGLVIIMTGATVITLTIMDVVLALLPLMLGLLAAFVGYGRWRHFAGGLTRQRSDRPAKYAAALTISPCPAGWGPIIARDQLTFRQSSGCLSRLLDFGLTRRSTTESPPGRWTSLLSWLGISST